MEFRDVLKGGAPKATISVNKQGAAISLPANVMKLGKLEAGSKVRLQFGEQGKRRAIRVVPDAGGDFSLSARKTVGLLQAHELLPKSQQEGRQELSHELCPDGHLILTLPDNWVLARPDVVAGA